MNYKLALSLKDAGFPQDPFWQVDVNAWGGSWYYLAQKEACAANVFCTPDEYRNGLDRGDELIKIPYLSELIEACGADFAYLAKADDGREWKASAYHYYRHMIDEAVGQTSESAVARLWIALQNK